MNCNLYVEAEHNGDSYFVQVKKNILVGSVSISTVKALKVILDDCFTLGEYLDLKFLIEKIEEIKSAYRFPMPPYYGEENGLDREDYFRAYLVLEFLVYFAARLSKEYPLGIFAIRFE